MMQVFLFIFALLLSLGQLQRIQVSNNIAFYLHDCLIVAFLLKELFSAIVQRKKILEKVKKINKKTKKNVCIAIFYLLLSWMAAILAGNFDGRAILYLVRFVAYGSFVYLLEKRLNHQSKLWRIISFNILVLGFVQYFLWPDLRFLIYEGYDDHYYRLVSTILDPAFTGLIFVLNLNYYLLQKKKNWPLLILFALALLLTYSRSSYLAFLLSSFLLLLSRKDINNKKLILALLIVFLISIPFLPKKSGGDGVNLLRTNSVQARLSNDQEILHSMNTREWILGRGMFVPNNNRQSSDKIANHAHFADNLLVFMVSNLGILGSGVLLFFTWKWIKNLKLEKLILLSSFAVHAMFNNDLTQSFALLIFLGMYLAQD